MDRKYYSRYQPAVVSESEIADTKGLLLPKKFGKIFSEIQVDDLILLAIIFILITDEQPDFITILALIYIFLV